jgi:hypothetical protein
MTISMAGAEAAKDAETPQEAEQKVAEAVQEKARELRVSLDPDTAKQVGREVISQLEAMGAFRQEEQEPEDNQTGSVATAAELPPQPKKNWIQRLVSDDD